MGLYTTESGKEVSFLSLLPQSQESLKAIELMVTVIIFFHVFAFTYVAS